MKNILYCIALLSTLSNANDLEDVLSVIPNSSIESVSDSEISGLKKVLLSNGQVIYIAPKEKLIIVGEILNMEGQNLTTKEPAFKKSQTTLEELLQQTSSVQVSELNKSGINNNEKPYNDFEIIVFTNPYCGYCQMLDKELAKFKINTTRIYAPSDATVNIFAKHFKLTKFAAREKMDMNFKNSQTYFQFGTPLILVIKNNAIYDFVLGADMKKLNSIIGRK